MTGYLRRGLLTAVVILASASLAAGQSAKNTGKEAPKEIRLNGCISKDAVMPGQFTFLDDQGSGKYRLTGKNLKKFVGQRVEIVGGPPGKGVTFRTGLWPSPNVAAQAGAMDPAQAAIARMPGGAADSPGANALPEFHVVRLRGVDGGCS